MSSELDELMSLDPLELANSPEKLKKVIHFMREARANWDSGVKPTKSKKETKGLALIEMLKGSLPKPEGEKRRV